jgi:hypothetical protein
MTGLREPIDFAIILKCRRLEMMASSQDLPRL